MTLKESNVYLVANVKSRYVIAFIMNPKLMPIKIYGALKLKLNSRIMPQAFFGKCRLKPLLLERASRKEQLEMIESCKVLISLQQTHYINVINAAQILNPSTKLHFYDLLRGIGHMTKNKILKVKNQSPFLTYADFRKRVGKDLPSILYQTIKYELCGGLPVGNRILTNIYQKYQ